MCTDMENFEIDSSFPGGNIHVERIENENVFLHQELRDTGRDWFYWCFRIRGAAGKTLRFNFTRSHAIGVRGPALSTDEGVTWKWLGEDCVDGNSFICAFPENADTARLSFAMPYQESRWRRFMEKAGEHPQVRKETLCVTRKGRETEYLVLECSGGEPKHRAALACRHHCCEMMASYVLEGFIEWFMESEHAEWMRKKTALFIAPFADKDGVEDGDQGKGRKPRDHGRDYLGTSIYPATDMIRRILPEWGGDILRLCLDLHCPHISGPHNECIYMVGASNKSDAAEQVQFSRIMESVSEGPLPFYANNYLPYGQAWNNGSNSAGGKGFSRWSRELPSVRLGGGIEAPYANADGAEVNQETARLFGADLGKGITEYLRAIPETSSPRNQQNP